MRLHDNSRRYAVDILSRIANKSSVRGSVRGATLKSFDSYYPILDFIYRRCRAYSGRVDRALMDGRLKLPKDMNIQSDGQVLAPVAVRSERLRSKGMVFRVAKRPAEMRLERS